MTDVNRLQPIATIVGRTSRSALGRPGGPSPSVRSAPNVDPPSYLAWGRGRFWRWRGEPSRRRVDLAARKARSFVYRVDVVPPKARRLVERVDLPVWKARSLGERVD